MESKKTYVVTGGTGSFGKAISQRLLNDGHRIVAIHKQDIIKASELIKWAETNGFSDNLEVVKIDLTDNDACLEFAKNLASTSTNLAGLVNNAAIMIRGKIDNYSDNQFKDILNTNVIGLVNITSSLWSLLIRRAGNSVINISSAASRTGNPNELMYAASKGAVEAITRNLAREGGQYQLSVNAIAPHVIDSPMAQETLDNDQTIIDRIPFNQTGKIDELVSLVVYLLSADSSYLTGQIIHLNGGRLMMG